MLALVLITACGSEKNQTSTGAGTSGVETELNINETSADNQTAEIEIELNKTVESEPIAFTLTEIGDYESNYNINNDNHLDGLEKDNYSFILIYYEVKNTGKSTLNIRPASLSILYDGEYTFSPDNEWYFNPDAYSEDLKTKGSWSNSNPELGAFDPEAKCATVFQLPDEVKDNEKPLQIIITLPNDNNTYIYNVR